MTELAEAAVGDKANVGAWEGDEAEGGPQVATKGCRNGFLAKER